jgi:transcriptional regulator GlxA family with amidase domain
MSEFTVFIAFDGFQMLDVTGPCAVFGGANDALGTAAYDLTVACGTGGVVQSSNGLALAAADIRTMATDNVDSFFVVGGNGAGLRALANDAVARDWAIAASHHARRYGAICSGSTILAAWGLIGQRRFATHWQAVDRVKRHWPVLNLDPEAIFVEDGPLWTSAGVTTGIDMALAIVERDHGPTLAQAIAQRLVLSVRRPGWQSQFSPILSSQGAREGRYSDIIAWIGLNLDQPLGVQRLADRMGETLRSFHRNFRAATGTSPGTYVARQRIERARSLIGEGLPLKQVAAQTGFANVARLSASFQKMFGMGATPRRIVLGRMGVI